MAKRNDQISHLCYYWNIVISPHTDVDPSLAPV